MTMYFVSVPPRKLILTDSAGTTFGRSVVGPVHEGTFLEITCIAVGGKQETMQ